MRQINPFDPFDSEPGPSRKRCHVGLHIHWEDSTTATEGRTGGHSEADTPEALLLEFDAAYTRHRAILAMALATTTNTDPKYIPPISGFRG